VETLPLGEIMPSTLNEFLERAEKEMKGKKLGEGKEVMNEAISMEMNQTIDQFVRFLIGDRKIALKQLEKLKKVNVPLSKNMNSEKYNQLYGGLFKDIKQAIEKNFNFRDFRKAFKEME
jgi:acetoin utilization deacetylase AcuC-like enzyme